MKTTVCRHCNKHTDKNTQIGNVTLQNNIIIMPTGQGHTESVFYTTLCQKNDTNFGFMKLRPILISFDEKYTEMFKC